MSEHNIDKMFREKLGGHQAAYNPASWAAAEAMIEGKSSKGGFWLIGLLALLLCGAAIGAIYNFQSPSQNSIVLSSQDNVLLNSRIQEMQLAASAPQNTNSTLAMLKPSANNKNPDVNPSGTFQEKKNSLTTETNQPKQDISSASLKFEKGSSASANAVSEKSERINSQEKPQVSENDSNKTSSNNIYLASHNSVQNIERKTSAPKEESDADQPAVNKEDSPIDAKDTRLEIDAASSEESAPPKTIGKKSPSLEETSAAPALRTSVVKNNPGLLAIGTLPPALALYDLPSASFNASLLPVDLYSPSFWEIKFHGGFGYNVRSLKALEEGVEGYTALRDREESVGWSPEIGFEAIYEPGRLNYSIGLNWYSVAETNAYSPIVEYDTSLESTPIYTSIETSYFGVDSVWVQEKDSGGFFGYWEVFVTEELNQDSLVLYALDSALVSSQTPVDPLNERNTFQYIEIPLSIGYEFQTGNWSLGLRTGISAGFLVSTSGQYIDTDRQSAIVRQDITRRWIWNYHARIALGYALNDKTRVYLEPVFKTNINSIVNRTDFSQKYSTYGLRLGLGFKF